MATDAYDTLFEAGLTDAEATRGVTIGTLVGFSGAGYPLIELVNASSLAARSVVPLDAETIGHDVALLFEGGDPTRPMVIGVIQPPALALSAETDAEPADTSPLEVEADGKRVVLTGTHEVVLRCGKASIQLLSDGTVRIRGTNVLSRASATNRIRGGNVQIN
jgi:hypothetical protein